jgi:membrane associated rhomboid family serine protease
MNEKQKIFKSLIPPFLFILLLWLIKVGEILTHTELTFLGIYPLRASGLLGILTSPLIHKDTDHLMANSIPLFVLGGSLFYFYREIALKVLALILLITGLSVWIGGREAYHIGASGVVYGLASFLFTSGIIRREPRLLAITMLVTFLYGSMVWGIFPDFFPERNISYEAHLWGLVSGILLAFYYKKEGPQRRKYDWELEEELELDDNEDPSAESGNHYHHHH